MSMKMLSNSVMREPSAIGTSIPHCIMYCTRPTVCRHTDLPPALGPEMSRMRCSGRLSSMSSGTMLLPWARSCRKSSGWRAFCQNM